MALGFLNPFGDEDAQNEICPSLSYEHRLYGFAGCLCLGIFMSILSWISIFQRNFTMFGILFTISNCVTIGSSMFLAGPTSQIKRMFSENRMIATGVYIVAMVLTLVAALVVQSGLLVIVCCIVQYLAMIWYALSYIPFARSMVKNCFSGAVSAA
eukprot:GFYU01020962.1.p1 GENE.GFYU01020962.1~~GFYU01020962.1.p1  ORF type:complete len:155 (-),score=11.64 GFYU01020962.1:134-598(-)